MLIAGPAFSLSPTHLIAAKSSCSPDGTGRSRPSTVEMWDALQGPRWFCQF